MRGIVKEEWVGDSYLLDSNIFIQSHQQEYRFSFCGGFWDLLKTLHNEKIVFSINAVKKELLQGNDKLSQWVKTLPKSFFRDERDARTQSFYARLINWAQNNSQFTDSAKLRFASQHADPWLVAYAASNGMKLVTHEIFNPDTKKNIKIPNAADVLNVECVRLYDFLEQFSEGTFARKAQN